VEEIERERDGVREALRVAERVGVLVGVPVGVRVLVLVDDAVGVRDGVSVPDELGFIDGEALKEAEGVFGLPVGEGELLGGGAYRQYPPHSHCPLAMHKHSLSLPSRT